MKSVTEFWAIQLQKGSTAKAALVTEGKTPEEIQASMGESFKMEGDKLTHFLNAVDVADQNKENLSRVLVVSLNEGETVPPKAIQVEAHYYVPDFKKEAKAPVTEKVAAGKKGGDKKGKGGRGGGPKEGPWGLSPEQKAAKKAGQRPQQ